MAIRLYKAYTPGTRNRTVSTFNEITRDYPEKSLVISKHNRKGHNNQGRITSRHRGGGHKKQYRIIDFKRNKHGIPGVIKSVEYDPNRTAFISLVAYADGEKRYIVAPEGIKVGDKILSGEAATPDLGNTLVLNNIPLGTIVHNIELEPGRGGVIARSAGTYAQLANKDGKYAIMKMPSGETRMILLTCQATIGTVSNSDHSLQVLAKAGRNRWKGKRPRTRGVAMNPVDHPMGGGEGKSSGGHPRSRTGLYAKGKKTRNRHKASSKLIISKKKARK